MLTASTMGPVARLSGSGSDSLAWPRVGLVVLLVAAAFPVRFTGVLTGAASVSLFDLAMPGVLAAYLLLIIRWRSVASGRPYAVLQLGAVIGLVCFVSQLWTTNPSKTLLTTISYAEAVLVFLYVLLATRGSSSTAVVRYICLYVTLLLIPALLLQAHVQAFQPPADVSRTSGDYLSYFVRLSHPFIGRSNNLATLLAFFAIPLLYWALRHGNRMAGLFALITFTAVVLTFSRGVLLGLVIGFVGFVLTTRGIRLRVFALSVMALVLSSATAYLFYTSSSDIQLALPTRLTFNTVQDRIELLSIVGDTLNGNWWIGSGGGSSASVHNVFLQQFVDYGLFLSIPLSVLFVHTVRTFFGKRSTEASRVVGWSMVAIFVSFVFESSFEGTLLLPLLFLGFGLGVALVLAENRSGSGAGANANSS